MWKIGIHNCYWLGTGYDELHSAIKASAASGVDVYEMNTNVFTTLDRDGLLAVRDLAKELGLELTVNGGYSAENDISADDAQVRSKGIAHARTILEGMALVGAKSWSGINYSAWKRVPEHGSCFSKEEKSRIRDISVASLKTIMPIAEDCGVDICFEVVNRYEQFLCNTVAEGVDLAQRVDSKNCKVLVDTYHMNIEEGSITEAIRFAYSSGKLGEVHVGESDRRIPGTGKTHMNWAEIFGTLKEVGYDGLITMEPFVIEGLPISSRICVWRDLSGGKKGSEFIEDVKTGVRYIKSFGIK